MMNQLNWKRCSMLIMMIMLVAALVVPVENTARAEGEGQPEIFPVTIREDNINMRFTKEILANSGSMVPQDFVVKVNGVPVNVTNVYPFIDSDKLVPVVTIILENPVIKGDTVTIQYINQVNPMKDIQGKELSTAVVDVTNKTPGEFLTPPVLKLPSTTGYKLKAGDRIVTFTPTSGNPDRIFFGFPIEEGNDTWIEMNGEIHNASDYVILNNTDATSYTPKALDLSLDSVEIQLPDNVYLEEGKSYTLAMSNTAGGNEVRLPIRPTTWSEAYLALRRSDDPPILMDEYYFKNLVFKSDYKAELTAAINEAQNLYNNAVEGNDQGQYPVGSKAIFQAAIDKAVAVKNNVEARQSEVNAAVTALNLAVATFEAGKVAAVVNKGALNTAITKAQTIYNTATEGTAPGQYRTGSKAILQAAIDAAVAVKNNVEAMQSQVDTAVTALNEAVAVFEAGKVAAEVNKGALNTAITNAQTIYNTATEGTAPGQYQTGSKATLQAAIDAAVAVLNNELSTQVQVNNAVATLNEAVKVFERNKIVYGGGGGGGYSVTGVSLDQSEIALTSGMETAVLRATISPSYASNPRVKWSSSDPEVATVDDEGVVTPVAPGTATITVTTLDQAKTATCTVKVVDLRLEVSKKSILLKPNKSASVKVYAIYANGNKENITKDKEVTYSSSSKEIATVTNGAIKAGKKEDKVTITVTYQGKKVKIPVLVSNLKVTKVEMRPANLEVRMGEAEQLQLTTTYSNKKTEDVTDWAAWSSSNPEVATVDESGKLKAIAPGEAVITAAYGGKTTQISIKVSEAKQVKRLHVSKQQVTVVAGKEQSVKLTAYFKDNSKKIVTDQAEWSSEDEKIATVEKGVISGKAPGTVKIKAKYQENTVTITVTVTN
ncbi:Ig-like domain-containing protein [Brevibacillus ginsengisoli]|uniref:Ig-like domain-containing protein n=1 Tax=Brevibacillus ginsengisoli TaxID=363854 RepID=UPI003CF91391